MPSAPHRLRLSLELAGEGDHISGRLSDETGAWWDFIGWLELATAIEEAHDQWRERGDPPAHAGSGEDDPNAE